MKKQRRYRRCLLLSRTRNLLCAVLSELPGELHGIGQAPLFDLLLKPGPDLIGLPVFTHFFIAEALGEYRLNGYKLMIKYVHPDAILFHDDWGAKTQPFMKQEQFQEILKKPFTEGYKYVHDQGIIVIHHSDSFNENIVSDMIDMYIDVWQGTLPTNDIAGLIEKYGDKITFQGGLESSIFDGEESTEEQIRADVRRACFEYGQHGSFIPCITYGGPGCFHPERDAIIDDEIGKCSEEIFGLY